MNWPNRIWKNRRLKPQIRIHTEFQGTTYGGWTYCPEGLSSSSIVYSFGVGDDISFDEGIIDRFGCSIFAFDPTPRSIQWMKNHNVNRNRFHFYPFGIYDFNGDLEFFPPPNPSHISYSVIKRQGALGASRLPVKRLATIIKELGHTRIDILKMDIEASEYTVIPTIVDEVRLGLVIDQLLIEFHHRFEGKTVDDTLDMVDILNNAGYKIFSVRNSQEFSFKRTDQGQRPEWTAAAPSEE